MVIVRLPLHLLLTHAKLHLLLLLQPLLLASPFLLLRRCCLLLARLLHVRSLCWKLLVLPGVLSVQPCVLTFQCKAKPGPSTRWLISSLLWLGPWILPRAFPPATLRLFAPDWVGHTCVPTLRLAVRERRMRVGMTGKGIRLDPDSLKAIH